MHEQVMSWVARQVANLPEPPGSVLEIGSLDINGSIRGLFGPSAHYHGLDIVDGPGVDEVADAATWRPPRRYDLVACVEVLEHADRWADIVATMWRAVAAGGTLLVTCATDPRPPHSAVDGLAVRDGERYANVDHRALLGAVLRGSPLRWSTEIARDRGDLYVRADVPRSHR